MSYRPISLNECGAKIIEAIILELYYSSFKNHISSKQHGGQKNLSVGTAISANRKSISSKNKGIIIQCDINNA